MNEKEGEMILCEHRNNYCQGFNKCMKKENDEINVLAYMGKWQALVRVEPKFCLWRSALSEHDLCR